MKKVTQEQNPPLKLLCNKQLTNLRCAIYASCAIYKNNFSQFSAKSSNESRPIE